MRVKLTISGQLTSNTANERTVELTEAPFAVGRDGDWRVGDTENKVSRRHLELSARDGQVYVKDVSSRGTAIGRPDTPLPPHEDYPLKADTTLFIPNGQIKVVLEREDYFGLGSRERIVDDGPPSLAPPVPKRREDCALLLDDGRAFDPFAALLATKVPPSNRIGTVVGQAAQNQTEPETPPPGDGTIDSIALASLFEALGLQLDAVPQAERVQTASEIGTLFVAMAETLADLVAQRQTAKMQLGVTSTVVETQKSPFRVLMEPKDVASALLKPLAKGFLSGRAAVDDVSKTMNTHQAAMVASIDAVLRSTIAEFDPQSLEAKLEHRGLAHLLPGRREADLWGRFCEEYDRLSSEMDADMRKVIGETIDRAYREASAPPPPATPRTEAGK